MTKRNIDWGQEGQMQVNSTTLTLTWCTKGKDDNDYAEWTEEEFETEEELDEKIKFLEEKGFFMVG